RLRAELMASTGLPAVADGKHEEGPLPVKAWSTQPALFGPDAAEMSHTGQQIGRSTEQLLQLGRSRDRHLRAEPPGGYVEERAPVDAPDVHSLRGPRNGQPQGPERIERDAAGVRQVVGGAERQDRQARRVICLQPV